MKQAGSKSKEANDFTFEFYPAERQTIDKSTITGEDALKKIEKQKTRRKEAICGIYIGLWVKGESTS